MREILITLDYELFFGKSGSIEQSIIHPTEQLLLILDKYNIKASFFIDSGYILKLIEYKKENSVLKKDYDLISNQIRKLNSEGHNIELHIHPHWEDSSFDGENWVFNTGRYKLSDFSVSEIDNIIKRYRDILFRITGVYPKVYRAGGWCIQPFHKLFKSLKKYGVYIDSTIYLDGKNTTPSKSYDFSNSPNKNNWRFFHDPLIEDKDGDFLEIPISSIKLTPLFYLKFIYFKFFGGNKHKAFGDGYAIRNSRSQILQLLSRKSNSVASIDGYKASLLDRLAQENIEQLVLIGHPKAFTPFSLQKLDLFIQERCSDSRFITYSEYNE